MSEKLDYLYKFIKIVFLSIVGIGILYWGFKHFNEIDELNTPFGGIKVNKEVLAENNVDGKLNEQKDDILSYQEDMDSLKEELDKIRKEKEIMEEKFAKMEDTKEAKEKILRYKKNIENLEDDFNLLKEEKKRVNKQLDNLTNELSDKNKKLEEKDIDIEAYKSNSKYLKDRITKLQIVVAKSKETIKKLEDDFNLLKEEKKRVNKQLNNLTNELSDKNKKLEEREKDIETYKSNSKYLKDRITKLQIVVAKSKETIKKLENDFNLLKENKKRVNKKLNNLTNELLDKNKKLEKKNQSKISYEKKEDDKKNYFLEEKVFKEEKEYFLIKYNPPIKGIFENTKSFELKRDKYVDNYKAKITKKFFLLGTGTFKSYNPDNLELILYIDWRNQIKKFIYTGFKEEFPKKLKFNISNNLAKELFSNKNKIKLYGKSYFDLQTNRYLLTEFFIKNIENKYISIGVNNGFSFILIDGLMYQNQPFKKMTWKEANNYCLNLDLKDLKDWRLPTRKELRKLLTKEKNKNSRGNSFYIRKEFIENINGKYGYFWTSEEKGSTVAWVVNFRDGSDGWYYKTHLYYVLCVRE